MKKLVSVLMTAGMVSFATASTLNLSMNDGFKAGEKWEISMNKGGTYYIMLPLDVDFSKLQNSLKDNETLQVYRWYQTKIIFEADFGVKSLVIIKVTKTAVTYYVYNPDDAKYVKVGSTFEEAKKYLLDNIAPKITDSSKKSVFEISYVASLDKIRKNKLYLIKPKSSDLTISIDLGKSTAGTCSTGSADSLLTPPSVPTIKVDDVSIETNSTSKATD